VRLRLLGSARVARVARSVALAAIVGASAGCGGPAEEASIGRAKAPVLSARSGDEWPVRATSVPADTVDAKGALASPDGAQLHVRAYLVAVTLPCPACNVSRATTRSDPRGTPPGCAPCPPPAVTFADAPPLSRASDPARHASDGAAPLRAIGGAEGLQARHVGQRFLLTGTYHASGEGGPALDVTDVRALDE
jgi:hypothetical protein